MTVHFVLVLAVAVLGLLVGSFLNVVIARVPAGESVVKPPSHCRSCGTTLAWRDNVPVVSWLVLRGCCRACGTGISARYPVVEASTAALFAVAAARVGPHADLPAHLVVAAGFVALSVVDLDCRRLPDRIVFPTLALGTVALVVAAAIDDRWGDLGRAGIGAAIGFVALGAIHAVRPDGMGFGDVKLALVCGGILGWHGLADVMIGLYSAFVLGGVVGVALIATGRVARRGASVPFGPFLCASALLTVLALGPLADALRDVL
jgi:leader peptidase (prepilin peptidase)/N-methyltransferase